MPYINAEEREIAFKVVYYGPGMSGKTTNLVHIHRALAHAAKSDLVTLDTESERTLFFDFLPLELGRVDGYAIRFNVFTIPGQSYYEASRRLILEGVDGVVFVADSRPDRCALNVESYHDLARHLRSYDVDPQALPLVLQYNKRDCEDPLPLGTVERAAGLGDVPVFEAVATRGVGVMETMREAGREIVRRFQG